VANVRELSMFIFFAKLLKKQRSFYCNGTFCLILCLKHVVSFLMIEKIFISQTISDLPVIAQQILSAASPEKIFARGRNGRRKNNISLKPSAARWA
jgi:hypothetical protein